MSDRLDVEYERRAILYHPDGRAIVRTAGFQPQGSMQTTGQFPQLTSKPQKPKKTGKKSGKGRGC